MSLFQQLEKLNIPLGELKNLTEKEIIRIEKKLKADIVLKKDIDINEVNLIISTLRDSKDYLEILLAENMTHFRSLIANPKKMRYFSVKETPRVMSEDHVKKFIKSNFADEIKQYINQCIRGKNYRALQSFLQYRGILDDSIIDEIQSKLIKKIEFAIECLEIKASNLDDKIDYLYNPFFFRCFNYFDKSYQENIIIELINCVISKIKTNKTLYRILYSLGIYVALASNLKKTIKGNKSAAIYQGVNEQQNFKKYPEGGTISSRDNYKNSKQKHFALTFSLLAGLVLFVVFMVSILNYNSSKQKEIKSKYENPFIFAYLNLDSFKRRTSIVQTEKETQYFDQKPAFFHEDSIGLKYSNFKGKYRELTTIKNHTKKHVMLVLDHNEGYRIICIKPFAERITASVIDDYVIYRGNSPITYKFLNKNGIIQNGFKFKEFDKSDYFCLNKKNDQSISMIPFYSYKFNIFDMFEKIEKTKKKKVKN